MLCFRDMTFCSAVCLNRDCYRNWNDARSAEAKAWWKGDGAPVAFSDMSDGCPDYQPKEPQ